ncbi:MAG TPA: hypothetical protein VM529_00665 [Gemmata sp.]|nr:hypothetical protein [Gemmata sp.]
MPELSLPVRAHRGAAVKALVRSRADPSRVAGPFAAYLDTGASVTVLDPGVVAALGLEPVAAAGLHVLGRDEVSHHGVYEVEVALAAAEPAPWVAVAALEGPVNPKGTAAALGRDFLAHVTLVYDGPAGRFAVRW